MGLSETELEAAHRAAVKEFSAFYLTRGIGYRDALRYAIKRLNELGWLKAPLPLNSRRTASEAAPVGRAIPGRCGPARWLRYRGARSPARARGPQLDVAAAPQALRCREAR